MIADPVIQDFALALTAEGKKPKTVKIYTSAATWLMESQGLDDWPKVKKSHVRRHIAVRRTPRRRAAFFSSYLSTLIERDVLEVSSIERQGDMYRLLALLAGRVSGLLVPGTLAGQAGS